MDQLKTIRSAQRGRTDVEPMGGGRSTRATRGLTHAALHGYASPLGVRKENEEKGKLKPSRGRPSPKKQKEGGPVSEDGASPGLHFSVVSNRGPTDCYGSRSNRNRKTVSPGKKRPERPEGARGEDGQ